MPATRASSFDSEVDALFQRPLSEFIAARNALAGRLKKERLAAEAEQVKGLAKPSTPAWAVNQLFWQEPKAFERLVAVTERVRKAQTGVAKNADLPALLDEKKKMMAALMTRASAILADSGHAATPDVMRRISATLESLAVWGRAEGVPRAGRLTADLDPPGFEALAAFMSGRKIEPAKVLLFRAPKRAEDASPLRKREDSSARRKRAREAVQSAEKALREARRAAERADAAVAKADTRTASLEAQKREIEARYAEAKAEALAASTEAKKAAQAVADAERALARARAEVE